MEKNKIDKRNRAKTYERGVHFSCEFLRYAEQMVKSSKQ